MKAQVEKQLEAAQKRLDELKDKEKLLVQQINQFNSALNEIRTEMVKMQANVEAYNGLLESKESDKKVPKDK